jgi:hypothetical protein
MRVQRIQAISVRLDPDLQSTIQKWLIHNPGLNMTRLTNLAIRRFVSEEQTLKINAVKTVVATKTTAKASLKRMMKKHRKTLDELK